MTNAEDVMKLVNSALGSDVLKMATAPEFSVDYIPTGVLPMDILLHGGLPRGRFVEIYGDYSSLKSYIGLSAIAQVQKRGGVAAVIDTEHSFDEEWAKSIGVDTKALIIQRPENGELAIDTAEALIRAKVDLIVFDSIAAALPKAEQEKRLYGEKVQPGRLAYLMSVGLRKLTAANEHTSMLWINQTRLNIGITFGSPEAIPGGKSMPFYASFRISMKKVGKITRSVKQFDGEKWADTKEQIGQKFKAEVTKSKLSRPFRDVFFIWNLINAEVSNVEFMIAQGLELGLINQKGNSWSFENLKAVGRQKFLDALTADHSACENLENEIRRYYSLPLIASSPKATSVPKGTGGSTAGGTENTSARTSTSGKRRTIKKSRRER